MDSPKTPKDYQDLLTSRGGLNQYGEPNYILQWGSSLVPRKPGFPEMFLMPSEGLARHLQCWVLAEWKSSEELGDPDLYDFPTDCGIYMPLQVFRDEGQVVQLDTRTLNKGVLDLFMWVILNHKHDSLTKREGFLKDERAKAKAAETQQMIDRIEDGAPAFTGPVSFTGQLNVNSVVLQKMEQLEKNLTRVSQRASKFPRGGIMQQSASL